MFAPERTDQDRILLGRAAQWLRSGRWDHDLQPHLSTWTHAVLGEGSEAIAKALDLSFTYADVNSTAGVIAIDGVVDVCFQTQTGVIDPQRLPIMLELRFGSGDGPDEPDISLLWLDGRGLISRGEGVAAA